MASSAGVPSSKDALMKGYIHGVDAEGAGVRETMWR